jgi:hypothetical protein
VEDKSWALYVNKRRLNKRRSSHSPNSGVRCDSTNLNSEQPLLTFSLLSGRRRDGWKTLKREAMSYEAVEVVLAHLKRVGCLPVACPRD